MTPYLLIFKEIKNPDLSQPDFCKKHAFLQEFPYI